MKALIIRKPKFMRSDECMKTYISVASSICDTACLPDITPSERVELLIKASECINKAAKSGGFFTTKDFLEWARKNNSTH